MTSDSSFFLFRMMGRTWRYAGHLRGQMVGFYALFIAANLVELTRPLMLATIINAVQEGGPQVLEKALWGCAGYAAASLGFWSLHGPARILEQRLGFTVYRRFTEDMYKKVTEMPFIWHQDHHTGATISRVTKAGKALFTFARRQYLVIQTAVGFIGSLLMLGYFCWWLMLALMVVLGLVLLVVRYADRILRACWMETNEREHRMTAGLYDYIGNIVTVLTLRLQKHTRDEVESRFGAMREPYWKQALVNEYKWAGLSLFLSSSLMIGMGFYVGGMVLSGVAIAAGSVVAVFQYQKRINDLFFEVASLSNDIMLQDMDVRSVDGLMEDHARCGVEVRDEEGRAWSEIKIRNLSFAHHEGEDDLSVLRDVKMDIRRGRKIAMIGTSGAGKTTLLTLLRGLREPQAVRLAIDGVESQALFPLAALTTLVPQDAEIFENTVRYNLTLGMDVPDEVLRAALHIAVFEEVADNLPQGIETDIRERGVNLSGGQKQRLALARGIVAARDSSLLLLDEPTGSVDIQTEAAFFERLFAAFPDMAIVATVHRLHLLPRFDEICLMQDGTLVEQGTFHDLLRAGGPFAELWGEHIAQQEVDLV